MSNMKDFVIENGVLTKYNGNDSAVVIPDSVMSIGSSAFGNCSGLTSVEIGKSVTTIDEEAFSFCSSLKSIFIPDNVTSMGKNVLLGCKGIIIKARA